MQFHGFREKMMEYGKFADVENLGLADAEAQARKAGEWFQDQNEKPQDDFIAGRSLLTAKDPLYHRRRH